ncbi:oxygenase MpaB family protein [Kitasatospora sp. NPDC091207]|uniref:oxygenase MpaB family protein n=1 Tax=Kitasatospora sp. NPDC091207 TaxID=3364083 RepID=UPI003826985C
MTQTTGTKPGGAEAAPETETETETATESAGRHGPLFGPGTRFHRLFDDPCWAVAMIRATVLEAAHPQIGAALADSSTFVTHPWRRLTNTLRSLQRMTGTDEPAREREAARLNRMHGRLNGTDAANRPYDAMDPAARAWVVATMFESAVIMFRWSGRPLDQAAMEELYAEFRAFLAVMGDASGQLPESLRDFWPYYDRVVEEELENTEALRTILYHLFDHLPAPPLLEGLPTVWAAGRALAGPTIGVVTVASLPEAFRRRAGLTEIPGAQTLTQSAYLALGAARLLPDGWITAENLVDLLSLSSDSDDPRARTLAAVGDGMKRFGAFLRLITPLPDEPDGPGAGGSSGRTAPGGAGRGGAGRRGAEEFFDAVLDQTGNGYLDWPDLAAMARELSGRLDLDEPEETRLYTAFAAWWRELQSTLDTNGDGRISRQEYAEAVPSLAGPALIRVAEVLFDVTDADGNQTIDADEYRALFRTGFRRELLDSDGTYSRAAFIKDFLAFMAGRQRSTAYDPLLTQA